MAPDPLGSLRELSLLLVTVSLSQAFINPNQRATGRVIAFQEGPSMLSMVCWVQNCLVG